MRQRNPFAVTLCVALVAGAMMSIGFGQRADALTIAATPPSRINHFRSLPKRVLIQRISRSPQAHAPQRLPLSFLEIFNGYGQVDMDAARGRVELSPQAATSLAETHAALVRTTTPLTGSYRVAFTMTAHAQLRIGSPPNPWEVGWLTLGHNDDGTFKYLILKPNGYGVELGESLGNNAQNFLWTSPVGARSFDVGVPHRVVLEVRGAFLDVFVNDERVLHYARSWRDRLDTDGFVGFYSEDARVTFDDIVLTAL